MSPQPMHDPLQLIGTTIDKYRVEAVVGEGGFSVVYRAEHTIWKQPVALKCFKAVSGLQPAARQELLDGFIQEGKLMTNLSSRTAAIVQARDVGSYRTPGGDDILYMVLEWLEGMPLDAVMLSENRSGLPPRSLAEVIALLEPVASALETVHQLGICHRDIKPANLFVIGEPRSPQAFVKLLDFGIAKVMAEHAQIATALAQTGHEITAFTPNYGAPEQFSRTHGATGPWSDVFSLALIIVELMRGGVPALAGDDYLQLAVASRDPLVRPTPRAFGLAVSDLVESTFLRALAVSPKERFRTVGEFWSALVRGVYPEAPTWQPTNAAGAPAGKRLSIPTPGQAGGYTAQGPGSRSFQPNTPLTQPPFQSPTTNRGTTLTVGTAPPVSAPVRQGGSRALVAVAVTTAAVAGVAAAAFLFVWKKPAGPVATSDTANAATVSATGPAVAIPPAEKEPCPKGMALIPGGKFYQGTDNPDIAIANPAHKVTLRPFCMDLDEVTAGAYKACSDKGECKRAATRPDYPKPEGVPQALHDKNIEAYAELCNFGVAGREQHPINCVSWALADNYCKVQGGRLPTEAEWEFAARGSDGRKFPWGDQPGMDTQHMNAAGKEFSAWEKEKGLPVSQTMYDVDDGFAGTAPVGSFKAGVTRFGLNDMVGNVFEWTSDWFASYPADEVENPKGAPIGDKRAIRGGAFNGGFEMWLDPAFRYFTVPEASSHGIGFRCAKDVPEGTVVPPMSAAPAAGAPPAK